MLHVCTFNMEVFQTAVHMLQTPSTFHRKYDENHRKIKTAWNGLREMTTQIRHLQTYQETEKTPFWEIRETNRSTLNSQWRITY